MDLYSIIVISDTSIENNVATSILHIHSNINSIKKTIYHAVNITSTKAKLFTICYGINQAIQIPEVSHIIIITNAIYLAKYIFDSIIYLYQLQLIAIVQDLRAFFNKYAQNLINF